MASMVRWRGGALLLALVSILLLALGHPSAASAETPFTPPLQEGGISLVIWQGGSVADLEAAVGAGSVTVFVGGKPLSLVVDAPAFVNAAFHEAFPNGVDAGVVMAVLQTPGATVAPSSVQLTLGAGLTEDERDVLDAAQAHVDLITSLTGMDVSSVSIFASADPDELTTWWGETLNVTHLPTLNDKRQRWANIGAEAVFGAIFMNTGSPPWTSGARRGVTLAHELFHIASYELLGQAFVTQLGTTPPDQVRAAGPDWLVEGSAEYIGQLVESEHTVSDFDAIRAAQAGAALGAFGPLEDMATLNGFRAALRPYEIGFMAVELLVADKGLASLGTYYRLVGDGIGWSTAFEEAFGESIDAFHQRFEAHRAAGFELD